MSDTIPPPPDYGVPWIPSDTWKDIALNNRGSFAAESPVYRDRIIACVNACAGMADPAKEIAALRESLLEQAKTNAELRAKLIGWHENETIRAMREAIRFADQLLDADGYEEDNIARAKLQPFLKP